MSLNATCRKKRDLIALLKDKMKEKGVYLPKEHIDLLLEEYHEQIGEDLIMTGKFRLSKIGTLSVRSTKEYETGVPVRGKDENGRQTQEVVKYKKTKIKAYKAVFFATSLDLKRRMNKELS